MPKIRIKSLHPQVTVTVRTLWKESFYEEQCELLKNNFTTGLMRLVSFSGKNADFSAPADMKICDMLREGIDKDTYFKIIAQIINVLRWLQAQKLSVSNLNLRTDYVFVNSKTKELFMLYIPVDGDAENGSLKAFLRQLVFESSFRLGEDTGFKQELMNLLNSGTSINSKTLGQYVLTYCPEVGESLAQSSSQVKSKISDSKSEYLRQIESQMKDNDDEPDTPVKQGKGTDLFYGKSRSLGEPQGTVVLNEDNGTVVLNEESGTVILDESAYPEETAYPKLIRRGTGEEVFIDKPVFRIGKEEGVVDYLIPDNPTISRSHADIISRNGRYYLYDNNSTNRSYVNNIIVESLKNIEIYDGTVIRLSDEEFEFRIMNY